MLLFTFLTLNFSLGSFVAHGHDNEELGDWGSIPSLGKAFNPYRLALKSHLYIILWLDHLTILCAKNYSMLPQI